MNREKDLSVRNMTAQQFNDIKWSFISHAMMDGYMSFVRRADTPFPLLKCSRVRYNPSTMEPKGRTTVHYMLNGKIIKTKEKLLKEIEGL